LSHDQMIHSQNITTASSNTSDPFSNASSHSSHSIATEIHVASPTSTRDQMKRSPSDEIHSPPNGGHMSSLNNELCVSSSISNQPQNAISIDITRDQRHDTDCENRAESSCFIDERDESRTMTLSPSLVLEIDSPKVHKQENGGLLHPIAQQLQAQSQFSQNHIETEHHHQNHLQSHANNNLSNQNEEIIEKEEKR